MAAASAGEAAVCLEGVTVGYVPGKPILHDVSLRVGQGEFVALLGANGSGKSTLARLVVGLLHPQAGSVRVLGADTCLVPLELLSQKVGYLFQNPDAQLFNSSIEAEVAFGMQTRRMPRREIEARVDEVLALLGLQAYRQRHPFSISRGERQRLALATVLVTDPDVIILDEPTTGQDRRMLNNLIALMSQWIARKQATVLMISHDMDLVCEHAKRTVVISEGRIVADGPTVNIFHDNYHLLEALHLRPPPVVEISRHLAGAPPMVSIDEFERLAQQWP
jgi:energy-coupling factor transport system ATP-binding protein